MASELQNLINEKSAEQRKAEQHKAQLAKEIKQMLSEH